MVMSRRKLLKQGGLLTGLTLGSILTSGAQANELPITTTDASDDLWLKPKDVEGNMELAASFDHRAYAPTDGFSFGYMECDHASRGTVVASAGPDFAGLKPLTRGSAHNWGPGDRFNRVAAFCMPVLKGQLYRVFADYSNLPIPHVNNFSSWNFDNLFGAPVAIPVTKNVIYRDWARTDGLLVVSINNTANGDRAYATLTAGGMLRAACSMHIWTHNDTHYPSTSFCAPVRAGEYFELNPVVTSANPAFTAIWFPFNKQVFGEPQLRSTGTVTAQTKGLAVAILDAAVNGNRGEISISASNKKLATSVHNYRGSDTWVRYNTLTMPIHEFENYRFEYTPTNGAPIATYYWMPISL